MATYPREDPRTGAPTARPRDQYTADGRYRIWREGGDWRFTLADPPVEPLTSKERAALYCAQRDQVEQTRQKIAEQTRERDRRRLRATRFQVVWRREEAEALEEVAAIRRERAGHDRRRQPSSGPDGAA